MSCISLDTLQTSNVSYRSSALSSEGTQILVLTLIPVPPPSRLPTNTAQIPFVSVDPPSPPLFRLCQSGLMSRCTRHRPMLSVFPRGAVCSFILHVHRGPFNPLSLSPRSGVAPPSDCCVASLHLSSPPLSLLDDFLFLSIFSFFLLFIVAHRLFSFYKPTSSKSGWKDAM